jgi:hypothetical protein
MAIGTTKQVYRLMLSQQLTIICLALQLTTLSSKPLALPVFEPFKFQKVGWFRSPGRKFLLKLYLSPSNPCFKLTKLLTGVSAQPSELPNFHDLAQKKDAGTSGLPPSD